MTTLLLRNSISRSPLRLGFLLIPLVCFGLSPIAQAVLPAPDGGYSGNNTAEGNNALFSLTTGTNNTAIGNLALDLVNHGMNNVALGRHPPESYCANAHLICACTGFHHSG